VKEGSTLGPYKILELIGTGGMGEVYRARDPRLGRDVAIKTLPAGLAADGERLQRFELEARAASQLSHPNILTIHDIGTTDGCPYIVSELLEGENLRERLQKGAIPQRKAAEIGVAVANALAAAHSCGIVHRDLKPENLFLTRDGRVKVLDFGIAKLTQPDHEQQSVSPTVTILTEVGTAVGTLGYMAPEQMSGQPVDHRADIFALGAILHEMMAGAPAFRRDSRIGTVNAVLESDPPPLPATVAPAIGRVISRCVEKDPNERFQSARDLAFALTALSDVATASADHRRRAAGATKVDWRIAALASLVVATIAGGVAWSLRSSSTPSRVTKHFSFQPMPPINSILLDLSRNGSRLAFTAAESPGGRRQLYVKAFDDTDAKLLVGTDGANAPFFSPDGQWIGFSADGKLKKVATQGGTPVTLCDAPEVLGGSWNENGQIVIAMRSQGLKRVSAEGGTPEPVTTPDQSRGEIDHHAPHWLPGGKAFLFTLHAGPEVFRVAVRSLDSGEQRTLIEDGFDARYAESGHIVYGRANTLLAAPFDLERLSITGPSVPVVENATTIDDSGVAGFSLASDGTLVFLPAIPIGGRRLTWVDRTGKAEALPSPPQGYDYPSLSPDGRRVAVQISEGARNNIFVYELGTDLLRRVTLDGSESRPVWSSDGKRLTYAARRKEQRHIFWHALDGSAAAESLVMSRNDVWPGGWTPDGAGLVYIESHPTEISDIKLLRRDGNASGIVPLVEGPTEDRWPSVSPDGRWILFSAMDRRTYQVYVRPFAGGAPFQVSTDGGMQARWSRDGREVFYRVSGRMMRAPIQTEPELIVGKPEQLFAAAYHFSEDGPPNYDVSADGKRFLMITRGAEEQSPSAIRVVVDWYEELKRRVPVPR
jgi:eukaryotic-like serine/threonine-protein kinase